MMEGRNYERLSINQLNKRGNEIKNIQNVPEHIAIIMDGNGRWAKKRGLPRVAGHREGMKAIKKIVQRRVELDVKVLTLYAFSTENWKRPKKEIDYLMRLPERFLDNDLPDLIKNNVKVTMIGDYDNYRNTLKKPLNMQ